MDFFCRFYILSAHNTPLFFVFKLNTTIGFVELFKIQQHNNKITYITILSSYTLLYLFLILISDMSDVLPVPFGNAMVSKTSSLVAVFGFDVQAPIAFEDKVKWEFTLGDLYGDISDDKFGSADCRLILGNASGETHMMVATGRYKDDKFKGSFKVPKSNKVDGLSSIDNYKVQCFVDKLPTYGDSATYTTAMTATVFINDDETGISGLSSENFKLTHVNALAKSMTATGSGTPEVAEDDQKKKGFRFNIRKFEGRVSYFDLELGEGQFHITGMAKDATTPSLVSCDVRMNSVRHLRENLEITPHTLNIVLPTAYKSDVDRDIEVHCPTVGVTKNIPGFPTYLHVTTFGNDRDNKVQQTFNMASRIEMKNSSTIASIAVSAGIVAASALAYFF